MAEIGVGIRPARPFRRLFAGEDPGEVGLDAPAAWNAKDTRIADYVGLPISFDGSVPQIDWRDEWSPEEFD